MTDNTTMEAVQLTDEDVATADEQLQQESNQRPEWLPEKFESPEALAKAYSELEGKLGSQEEEAPKETEEEDTTSEKPDGVDFDKYTSELTEKGELSDESYQELEAQGFTKDMVDTYVNGLKSSAQSFDQQIYDAVGGEESLKEMMEWAGKSYSDEDIQVFNDAFNSGDAKTARVQAELLRARYEGVHGKKAKVKLTGSQNKNPAGVKPYADESEMVKDINSPEYAASAAFRLKVQQRASISNI